MRSLFTKIITTGLLIIFSVSAFALVDPRGTEDTFEIATWNVEWFPKHGQSTIDTLAMLIEDLEIDLLALQEISDTSAFRDLLSQLPGWDGFFSPDITSPSSYQKTAIIYRTDQVSVLSWEPLFWNESYAFPRPPIRVTIQANLPTGVFNFYLIVMHLKAFDDSEGRARRFAAMEMLKEYLDVIVPFLPDHDWMVVGDYNDEADDPQNTNIFWDFFQDSANYKLLTEPLVGDPYWASYPSYNSLIDHMMVTTDCLDEYGNSGLIQTLRIDDEYSNYSYRISDHRPVMAMYTDFPTGIDDNDAELPDQFGLTAYPNPFNASTNISFSLEQPGNARIEIYNTLGQLTEILADRHFETGNYTIKFNASDYTSGVYFLRVVTDYNASVTKLNLIK